MEPDGALRRSLLAIPANERTLIEDAADSDADEVFFDLEDSLGPGEKEAARSSLVEAIEARDWGTTALSYRINGVRTRWWYRDVIDVVAEVPEAIDTIVVPKVRDPTDVRSVARLLSSVERNAGVEGGTVGLSVQIEVAAGMNAVTEIAHASDRLRAIVFGPADYTASIGASPSGVEYPGHYWHYPLSRIAHAAASADLLAIGGPYADPDDREGFRRACRLERALGYDGKVVIHPRQVETANEVFAPNPEEVGRARRIVRNYEAAGPAEVASIDGNVIDRETYRMAGRILARAERADVSDDRSGGRSTE